MIAHRLLAPGEKATPHFYESSDAHIGGDLELRERMLWLAVRLHGTAEDRDASRAAIAQDLWATYLFSGGQLAPGESVEDFAVLFEDRSDLFVEGRHEIAILCKEPA